MSTKVTERLRNVPPENIISPKPNVAGPALESLRYTGHEESLSDMYANLLATAMDSSTALGAHPAFVEIIRQLTPDEAKLVSLFLQDIAFPLLNVRWEYKEQTEERKGGLDVLVNHSQLGEAAGCEFNHLVPAYIDNLCRLGLADVPAMFVYMSPGVYDALDNSSVITTPKSQIELNSELRANVQRKGLKITELGKQFAHVCVARKA